MGVPQILSISSLLDGGSALSGLLAFGLGLLFLLIYTVAVLSRPTIALLTFVFTLAFHDFFNLPVTQDGFKLSTAILLSAFFIILAGILIRKAPDLFTVLSRRVNILVLLFLLAMIISVVNSQNVEFAKIDIQRFSYCVILYFFVLFSLKERSVLKRIALALVCGGFIVSVLGVVEAKTGTVYGLFGNHSLLGADVPEATLFGPRDRINGVLGDADFHGMYMGVIFLFSLCLFFLYESKMVRLLLFGTMLLCLFNVIGAASRGAALGSFVAFIIFWFFIPLPRKWLILTSVLGGIFIFACITVVLFPNLDIERFYEPKGQAKKTLELRENNLLIGLAMALDKPIIGHGPGGFTIEYHRYASRTSPTAEKKTTRPLNVYIQVFAEYGIVGLSLFLGVLFSALRSLFPLARSTLGEFNILSAAVLAALCGYSVFMMFTGLINDQNFWLLIALAVAIGTIHSFRAEERG
ncbi:MAG: O-antigen ligase family protein [bacterium]